MKKFYLNMIALIACLGLIISLVGCSGSKDKFDPFIGSFSSTWVEGDNPTVTFELAIDDNRTFSLTRFNNGVLAWVRGGTWVGSTSQDEVGIVCFIAAETNMYFTLTKLDDGSLFANSGVINSFGIFAGGTVVFAKA